MSLCQKRESICLSCKNRSRDISIWFGGFLDNLFEILHEFKTPETTEVLIEKISKSYINLSQEHKIKSIFFSFREL